MDIHKNSFKVFHSGEGSELNVMDAKTVYKATAKDTGGAYSLSVDITPPQGGLPLHVHHREDEAMFILDGEYEIQCGDQTVRVTKGAFVFLPRGIPNRFKNVTDAAASYLYITSPGGFETFMEEMEKIASSGGTDFERMKALLQKNEIEIL